MLSQPNFKRPSQRYTYRIVRYAQTANGTQRDVRMTGLTHEQADIEFKEHNKHRTWNEWFRIQRED